MLGLYSYDSALRKTGRLEECCVEGRLGSVKAFSMPFLNIVRTVSIVSLSPTP